MQAAVIPTHSHSVVLYPGHLLCLAFCLEFSSLGLNSTAMTHDDKKFAMSLSPLTPRLRQPLEGFTFIEGRDTAAAWAGLVAA